MNNNQVVQQLAEVYAQLVAAMSAQNASQLRRQLWARYNALRAQVAQESQESNS